MKTVVSLPIICGLAWSAIRTESLAFCNMFGCRQSRSRICSQFLQFKKAKSSTRGLDNPTEDAVVSQGTLKIKKNLGTSDPRGKKRQAIGKPIRFPECFFRGIFIHLDVLPHKDGIIAELDRNLSSSGGESSSLQDNLDKIHDDSPFVHDVKTVVSDGSSFVSGSEQGHSETNLQRITTMKPMNSSILKPKVQGLLLTSHLLF